MRLARKLARIVFVLAVVAAALGGAVALGSSIFPSPPRDAAEFAERIAGGSQRGERAERRYVRRLNALCARYDARTDALVGRPPVALLDGMVRERRAFVARFQTLEPPARYEQSAREFMALEDRVQPLLQQLADAFRAGASGPPPGLERKLDRLETGYDELLRELDARKCTSEWADRH